MSNDQGREREQFSDDEFEKFIDQSGTINSLSSILAVREKTRSIIEMFKVEAETYSSIEDDDLKSALKEHLTELMRYFKASMTQFDLKILEELGVSEEDDESPEEDEDEL